MEKNNYFILGSALLCILLVHILIATSLIKRKSILSRKMEQRMEICRLNKSKLGLVPINEQHLRSLQFDEIEKANNWVFDGGYWSPIYEPLNPCQPLGSVVIIFPFRGREEHLLIMLSRLHPMLRKQFLEYHIIVIEQAGKKIFNRASLFNVGFLEAARDTLANCFIFHDIDLYPENDLNIYSCTNAPIHFSGFVNTFNYTLPYKTIYGGVNGITRNQFLKVNGFSNLYWGWGGEDDDMFKRLTKYFMIHRPNRKIGRYTMLNHTKRNSTIWKYALDALLNNARKRMMHDGLCSIKYQVLSDVKFHLYRRIKVRFDAPSDSHELLKLIEKSFFKLENVGSTRDIVIPSPKIISIISLYVIFSSFS